ncbi:MAG: SpoIIE family protein phosphatase [Nocardioides sp.]|nr:SpoIIE family protein phosphatase [Nocardioides sp.]
MSTANRPSREREAHTPAYDVADLTNCDREPIHVPGAVQPHGLLLGLDDAGTVVVASANCPAMVGASVEDVVGSALADVVGTPAARSILALNGSGDLREPIRLVLTPAGGVLAEGEADVVLHRAGERVVVEIEPRVDLASLPPVSYRSARGAVLRLTEAPDAEELTRQLAREVRDVTGFDRVMVYRFDADWNGEVVAEDKREDLNAFLGLHYPASDIPAQARRLYTVNWTRLIADVGYDPVPLHPFADPATGAPLDQSHSVLRSVSPLHIEYLSNMGVTASMSVSLIVDGRLWGLVACHHYAGPHRPSLDARSAAEFLGQSASALLADRLRNDVDQATSRAAAVVAGIIAGAADHPGEPHEALLQHPDLLDLFDASGAAVLVDGRLHTVGEVPDEVTLRRIGQELHTAGEIASSTDALGRRAPRLAQASPVACGALRVGGDPDRWLLVLRPEILRVVDWGGDPTNKALALAEGPDVRLSPRRSFDKWRQEVRGTSIPWEPWQLDAARRLDAGLSATAVRQVQNQVRIAESLQRSVVPETAPHFPGLELSGLYRPAQGGQLGGDWWDALALADGRVAVVVGDVSGHGVRSATAMSQVRMALRAYLIEGAPIAACLDKLDAVVTQLLDGHTATVLVAAIDLVDRTVEIASAGHLPPLLLTTTGGRVLEVASRPLLGVGVPGGESTVVELGEGDVVLLYTDGMVEERHIAIDRSIAGALARAEELPVHGGALEHWLEGLLAGVGSELPDDRTAVAFRLVG